MVALRQIIIEEFFSQFLVGVDEKMPCDFHLILFIQEMIIIIYYAPVSMEVLIMQTI